MNPSSVVGIYLHSRPQGPMVAAPSVRAEAGRGLEGDTYFSQPLKPDQEVTLIESEALEFLEHEKGIALDASEARRNLVTAGVALNPLVGREFRVGEVVLRGMRLCHPCAKLQRLTQPGVLRGLVQRGGLRAQIVEGGTIRVGDPVATDLG